MYWSSFQSPSIIWYFFDISQIKFLKTHFNFTSFKDNALKLHIECLEKFPKDLWNAKKTQLHAFNNGKKDQLLKVSKIVYDACRNEVELLKYVYGMHLFALQENKYYQEVIDLWNDRSMLVNNSALDCWSVHAICHSLHGLGKKWKNNHLIENQSKSFHPKKTL